MIELSKLKRKSRINQAFDFVNNFVKRGTKKVVCEVVDEVVDEVPIPVLELVGRVSSTENEDPLNLAEMYPKIKDFIFKNSTGKKLPKNKLILDAFKISDRQLREVKTKMVDDGLIEKSSPTSYLIKGEI